MLSEIFFQRCLGCGLKSDNGTPICADCIDSLEAHPYACESCGYPANVPVKICGHCKSDRHRNRLIITYKYKGALKKLIKEIKFSYRISGRRVLQQLIDTDSMRGYDIITDVPSHFTRKVRRVTHPATDTAKYIAVKTGATYQALLSRIRRTEYQYKLKKNQRAVNVKNAFECVSMVTGLKILLVDDIITTGSTIEECSRILKKSGASVVDVFALTGGSS